MKLINKKILALSDLEAKVEELDVLHEFMYYDSMVGDNSFPTQRSSGAYIFRPNGKPIEINKTPTVKVYKGPVVEEIHQTHSDWVSQVVRTYTGENHVEMEWLVGPIPLK